MAPDFVTYDPITNVVTIDGIRFARKIFESFASAPLGTQFEIVDRREDGTVTLLSIQGGVPRV